MLDNSMCPRWAEDFCEIQLHVDFENRLLLPLGVAGIGYEEADSFDVLLYGRERCHPNCRLTTCPMCRPRVLYKDCAVKPTGPGLPFNPHSEYLYCLKCHQRPATALLSLTPHEQDVEVKELGLLACWFAIWFQRAKASVCVSTCSQGATACSDISMVPVASVPPPPQQDEQQQQEGEDEDQNLDAQYEDEDEGHTKMVPTKVVLNAASKAALNFHRFESTIGVNTTSKYLPNMRIIYQVRKERMTVTLPVPNQLTRGIDVQLLSHKEGDQHLQTASLRPGDEQASCDLVTERDTAYTLMVRLPNMGQSLQLLDLVTERKVLRVQEARHAPKFMNFLMERRVDQRATFVLHVTFDEQSIDVGTPWLDEFYLDVDSNINRMTIGTVNGMERKIYRVEKMVGKREDGTARFDCQTLLFEGGVDPVTLRSIETIPLVQDSDYLISVVDPDTRKVLPTSILSIRSGSLYVKEIKGGDVRLHVTVQRELPTTGTSASNENNLNTATAQQRLTSNSAPEQVFQSQPDGKFCCPIDNTGGRTCRYRILHSDRRLVARRSGRTALRSSSRCSVATAAAAATDAALEAADASTYSCGGSTGGCRTSSRQDDSGLGRNPSSLSEGLDASTGATMHQAGVCLHLDVDLAKLKARLLPAETSARNASNEAEADNNSCYLIVEEPRLGGKTRSSPCQLGQEFSVSRWCRYTVKAIEECSVSPLFKFRLTDRDVTDVEQCGLQPVQLTQSVAR